MTFPIFLVPIAGSAEAPKPFAGVDLSRECILDGLAHVGEFGECRFDYEKRGLLDLGFIEPAWGTVDRSWRLTSTGHDYLAKALAQPPTFLDVEDRPDAAAHPWPGLDDPRLRYWIAKRGPIR